MTQGACKHITVLIIIGNTREETAEAFGGGIAGIIVATGIASRQCQIGIRATQALTIQIVTIAMVHLRTYHQRKLVNLLQFPVAGSHRLQRPVEIIGLGGLVGGIFAGSTILAQLILRQQIAVVVSIRIVGSLVFPVQPRPGLQREVDIGATAGNLVLTGGNLSQRHGIGLPGVGIAIVARLGPRAVGIAYGIVGGVAQRVGNNIPRGHTGITVRLTDIECCTQIQPFVGFHIERATQRDTMEVVVDGDTLL